jgi:hypothetical protein
MRCNWITLILLVSLAVPLLYFGSYLALVRPPLDPLSLNGSGSWPMIEHYRFGGKTVEAFFQPANLIDRKIRWDHWRLTDVEVSDRVARSLPPRTVHPDAER